MSSRLNSAMWRGNCTYLPISRGWTYLGGPLLILPADLCPLLDASKYPGFELENRMFAYLDPTAGSMALQLSIAGVLGVLFLVKNFWRQFRSKFSGGH